MMEIIPAILPKNYEDLKNKVSLIRGIVNMAQIDICDGRFVRTLSWPMNELDRENSSFQKILREEEGLPFWEEIDYEADLMVSNARENFDLFLKLGVKRVIFHLEAEVDLSGAPETLNEFKEFLEGIDLYTRENTQIGVAINIDTDISNLSTLISHIDFVQCMGIKNIGNQGEPFDEGVIDQIRSLRKVYPELIISVDGGVNLDSAPRLIDAGANRLVAGSAIFNSTDIYSAIREFQEL